MATTLSSQVNWKLYAGQTQKPAPTCGQCGKTLGVGFYYNCHVCGATYCYAHSPQKCDHHRLREGKPDPFLTNKP